MPYIITGLRKFHKSHTVAETTLKLTHWELYFDLF